MPAEQARALLNDDRVWRSYFKFAFDRNPWDRQVSFYHHRYRREAAPPPFASFIRSTGARGSTITRSTRSTATSRSISSAASSSLQEDLKHALGQVGLTLDQALPRAKTTFRRNAAALSRLLRRDTREIVGDWYAREIELLDYAF